MATRESTGAWLGSAVLHGAILAALLGQVAAPRPVAATPMYEIEVVELPTPAPTNAPKLAVDTAVRGDGAVISSDPPPPRPPAPTPKRADPTPPPAGIRAHVDAPQPEATMPVADQPSPTPAETTEATPAAVPAVHMLARPIASGGNSGTGSFGDAAGLGGDQDALDHSAYGAALVRIVKRELDDHPVPGISAMDTMRLSITVLPNGELAWTKDGKYGFAEVVHTSLGRVRMNQILKRIMIASARFPAHPHGMRQRYYTVDITFVFHPKR